MNTHVELDENEQPLVTGIDLFASKHLMFVLRMLFYTVPIAISMYNVKVLYVSRLLKYSSFIIGFMASIISWLFAMIIPWFVFGIKYDFAKDVFNLHSNLEFSLAVTFVFLLLPFSRFSTRTLNRVVTSYLYRKYLFIFATLLVVGSFVSILDFLKSAYNPKAYLFSFSVLAIIYFMLIRSARRVRNQRIQTRPNPFNNRPMTL